MQGAQGLSRWNGSISIIGSAAAVRHGVERRNIRKPFQRPFTQATAISIARTDEQYRQAAHLVRSAYADLGYDTTFLVSKNIERRADPRQLTILAYLDHEPAGTFSMFLDGPEDVQADLAHPEAIDALRASGRSIVEMGRFATRLFDSLVTSQRVIGALLNGVYLLCASLKQAQTTIVFEVNPHHASYWHSLGLQVVGPPRHCDRVNAPGILMVMDFEVYTRIMLECWPPHARTQPQTWRAWHRIIQYSLPWEDVDGVLNRISRDTRQAPDDASRQPSDELPIPLQPSRLFDIDPPRSF
jgi:hypothetical protein